MRRRGSSFGRDGANAAPAKPESRRDVSPRWPRSQPSNIRGGARTRQRARDHRRTVFYWAKAGERPGAGLRASQHVRARPTPRPTSRDRVVSRSVPFARGVRPERPRLQFARARVSRPRSKEHPRREDFSGDKMADEPVAMPPVADNITFENTYLQKPEDYGEVRSRRATRTPARYRPPCAPAPSCPRAFPPKFGTGRRLNAPPFALPSLSVARGTSSCADRCRRC